MINESVHTRDDQDIGDVYAVNRFFVVIKRGIVNVHYYYIPVSRVEGWDGRVLWLNVTEEQVKDSYERDRTPDSFSYYTKEDPSYSFQVQLPLIPPKISTYEKELSEPPGGDVPRLFHCPLCNQVFKTEDGLGEHMKHSGH